MTELGQMAHVPARTQLPVSAYFDEALFLPASKNSFSGNPRNTSATRNWCPKSGTGVRWSRKTEGACWFATSKASNSSQMSAATGGH